MVHVKICGVTDPLCLDASVQAGARFIGFVFYDPSPRFIDNDTAATLSRSLPTCVRSVGLFVNPNDTYLERVLSSVSLDMIQLHGDETPERASQN